MQRLTILLNDNDKAKIKKIAKEKQVSMGVLVRELLKKVLKEGDRK